MDSDIPQQKTINVVLLAAGPSFSVAGGAAQVGGRRLALLAYLILGEPVTTRDELCDLLWDGVEGTDSQHRLRELLSSTRKILPPGTLITEGRSVRVDRTLVSCDVADFRDAVAQGRFEDAVALYGADFMAGALPANASCFAEWADDKARQLNRELGKVLRKLVEQHRTAGQYVAAARWAERLWSYDRDDDGSAVMLLEVSRLAADRIAGYNAATEIRDHFRSNHLSIPHDLANELANAFAVPPTGPELHSSIKHEDQLMVPAVSQPIKRQWRPRVLLGVFAACSVLGLLSAFFHIQKLRSQTQPAFGGGGVLVYRDSRAGWRALRFNGPDATDTMAMPVGRFDSIPDRWYAYSPAANSVTVPCANPVSGNPDVCIRQMPDGPTRRIVSNDLDKGAGSWSPDGKWLLMASANSRGANFNYEAYAVDVATGRLTRLSFDPYQSEGIWSPDGSRIALQVQVPTGDSVFLTSLERDTTARYGFDGRVGIKWSPDGRALLITEIAHSRISVATIGGSTKFIPIGLERIDNAAWSPDSKLIAVGGFVGDERHIRICAISDCATFPMDLRGEQEFRWVANTPKPFVHSVHVTTTPQYVYAGDVVHVTASRSVVKRTEATDPRVTLTTPDSTIAWFDAFHVLHTLRAGTARIVASAGGFRTDTFRLDIRDRAPTKLLLSEAWTEGFDVVRWKPFGFPLPTVVRTHGEYAFRNNGDDSYISGAALKIPIQPAQGITLEWKMQTPLTGEPWQEVWIHLSTLSADSVRVGPGEPYDPKNVVTVQLPLLFGTAPPVAKIISSCGGDGPVWPDFPRGLRDAAWHDYVLQLHADGSCELYIDSHLLERDRVPLKLPPGPYTLLVGGRTYHTNILIGALRLYEGIRWTTASDGRAVALFDDAGEINH